MEKEKDIKQVLYETQSWFEFNKINKTEIENITDFFNNTKKSKTPELYIKYRDYMVRLYQ